MSRSENKHLDGKGPVDRERYEQELRRLQAELCRLQDWVEHKGLRIVIVFEGRDAAATNNLSFREA